MLRAQMTHLVQNVWKILSDTTPLQDVKNANAPLKEPSMPICLAISKVENASMCCTNFAFLATYALAIFFLLDLVSQKISLVSEKLLLCNLFSCFLVAKTMSLADSVIIVPQDITSILIVLNVNVTCEELLKTFVIK